MFIHIGGDTVIRSSDVVAILNSDGKDSPKVTKEFLKDRKKDHTALVDTTNDVIKSIVITKDYVYLSPISSLTLKKRSQAVIEFDSYTD